MDLMIELVAKSMPASAGKGWRDDSQPSLKLQMGKCKFDCH